MKKISFFITTVKVFNSITAQTTKMGPIDQKKEVVALLKAIETGEPGPVGVINSQQYKQHNPAVADGLAGFGALLQALPKGSAKVNTVRVFQDGDFVFAQTDYNFFGPKIGFDIFRFQDGKIGEHWDVIETILLENAWKNQNGKFNF